MGDKLSAQGDGEGTSGEGAGGDGPFQNYKGGLEAVILSGGIAYKEREAGGAIGKR